MGLIKRSFGLKAFFYYYRNKWSHCGPDNFGLNHRVGLTVVLISGDYCIRLKTACDALDVETGKTPPKQRQEIQTD